MNHGQSFITLFNNHETLVQHYQTIIIFNNHHLQQLIITITVITITIIPHELTTDHSSTTLITINHQVTAVAEAMARGLQGSSTGALLCLQAMLARGILKPVLGAQNGNFIGDLEGIMVVNRGFIGDYGG